MLDEDIRASTEDVACFSKFGLHLFPGERLVGKLRVHGLLKALYPVHNPLERQLVFESFAKSLIHMPLDGVRAYYGESIAWYFAWLS